MAVLLEQSTEQSFASGCQGGLNSVIIVAARLPSSSSPDELQSELNFNATGFIPASSAITFTAIALNAQVILVFKVCD